MDEKKILPLYKSWSIPRKLSTISSQDRESIPNIEEEQEVEDLDQAEVSLGLQQETEVPLLPKQEVETASGSSDPKNKTTEAEVHAKLLNQTDFEWHPDSDSDHEHNSALEAEMVASEAGIEDSVNDPESEALLSKKVARKSEMDTATLPSASTVQPARIGSRYKNTHV